MNPFLHPRAGKWPVLPARGWQLLVVLACWLVPAMTGKPATVTEDFATNPLAHGWRVYGDTNLFRWDPTNQNLAVTWNSSQTNSYFYQPLGTILAKSDAFSVSFDLQMSKIADNSPQIAIGLFRFASATNAGFSRPAATTPNLFEFDYYANNTAGQPSIVATLTDTKVSSTNKEDFYFVYDNQPLNTGVTYHIVMIHAAGSTNLSGQVLVNGQNYSSLPNVFAGPITDFRIDTFSISSYGGGPAASPAQGNVDNIVVTLPPPPVQNLTGIQTNSIWQVQFLSLTNWLYTLERTTDFGRWDDVPGMAPGNGTNLVLQDTNPPAGQAFYRVRASRP
jgi:hypothetical protein